MSTLDRLPDDPRLHVSSYAELRARGASRRAIEEGIATGRIIRARRDVYVHGHDAPHRAMVVEALRVGGRLGCVSAAAFHGLWLPRGPQRLHVHAWDGCTRLRDPARMDRRLTAAAGVRVHWSAGAPADGTRCAVPAADAIGQMARCLGPLDAIRAAVSAAQRGILPLEAAQGALRGVRWARRPAGDVVDGLAGSGYETDAKLVLLEAGLSFRPQVWFDDVGFVDFVVEGCVVAEIDGREHHQSSFLVDRARDLALLRIGLLPVRVAATQLEADPGGWLAAIRAAVAMHERGGIDERAQRTRSVAGMLWRGGVS